MIDKQREAIKRMSHYLHHAGVFSTGMMYKEVFGVENMEKTIKEILDQEEEADWGTNIKVYVDNTDIRELGKKSLLDEEEKLELTGERTVEVWHKDGENNDGCKVYKDGQLADTKGKWEQICFLIPGEKKKPSLSEMLEKIQKWAKHKEQSLVIEYDWQADEYDLWFSPSTLRIVSLIGDTLEEAIEKLFNQINSLQ